MKLAFIAPVSLFALAMFSSVSFADIAPPMKPMVVLNLTYNGHPYGGEANVTYVCSEMQNGSAESVALLCQNGSCNNGRPYGYGPDWFGYGDSCFYSTGRFVVEADGRNATSDEVSLERGGEYYFAFDIGTGELTASENNPPPGPEPVDTCCLPLGILGLALAGTFASCKTGKD